MSARVRRPEIIRILLGCKRTTMSSLATEFGVSTRTINRDILALTVDEGYPINTDLGNGGGVYLTDYRHPHRHILSKRQIAVLTEVANETDPERREVILGILKAYA